DLAPGVLTIDQSVDPDTLPVAEPEPEVTGLVELPTAVRGMPLEAVDDEAPLPDQAALSAAVDAQLEQPGWYDAAAVVIADGLTGEVLYEREPNRPVTPASTQKLLSGAAVLTTLDPNSRLTTAAVRTGPDSIALV